MILFYFLNVHKIRNFIRRSEQVEEFSQLYIAELIAAIEDNNELKEIVVKIFLNLGKKIADDFPNIGECFYIIFFFLLEGNIKINSKFLFFARTRLIKRICQLKIISLL